MADAGDLKSPARKGVWVRIPPRLLLFCVPGRSCRQRPTGLPVILQKISSSGLLRRVLHTDTSGTSAARIFALFALAIGGLCACAYGRAEAEKSGAGPWPQWRGPDGLGVYDDGALPVSWSQDSSNVLWKTKIPGEGVSSPIISNERVIVTTAYESTGVAKLQRVVSRAGIALTVLLAIALIARLTCNDKPCDARWWRRGLSLLVTLGFVALALVVTAFRPTAQSLFEMVGDAFARLGLTDMEHLWSLQEGVVAGVWLTSGFVAVLGLAAVAVQWRARSLWRLASTGDVIIGAVLVVVLTPPDQWTEATEWWERVIFVLPGLAIAMVLLATYLRVRPPEEQAETDKQADAPGAGTGVLDRLSRVEFRWKHQWMWEAGGVWTVISVVLLLLLAALVFIPPNFIEPRLGVRRAVVCVDFETGDILWNRAVFTAPAERIHSDNTYATPTAVTDGERIVANFGVGVVCLDFEGRELWKQRDHSYIPHSRYGAASSPILAGDLAILIHQHELRTKKRAWVAAFDKFTGDEVWRIHPGHLRDSYSTPMVYGQAGLNQVIVPSWGTVTSFHAETGLLLWRTEIPTAQLVASPARSGQQLCVGGSTWGKNGTVMLGLDASNPNAEPEMLWSAEMGIGDCSPVIYDGMLFDAATGTIHWRQSLRRLRVQGQNSIRGGSRYLSSLLAGGGNVYAFDTDGLATVVKASSQFEAVARNKLDGRCYASPAAARGRLVLRIGSHLYCIGSAATTSETGGNN